MKFKEYSEIENTYRDKYINMIIEQRLNGGNDWVVNEKIHGSNSQLTTDGTEVKFGKRSCLLGLNNNFHNWEIIYDKYKQAILNAFKDLRSVNRDLTQLTVFGELYGGCYPHPDVPRVGNASMVQKGVFYCPHNDFIVFDMYAIHNNEEKGLWLPYDLVSTLGNNNGLMVLKTMFVGSLDDALKFSNIFDSTIHTYHNLPKIDNNICEGIVIKPNISKHFYTGERVILKSKNDKFAENKSVKKEPRIQTEESELVIKIYENLSNLINDNRLRNLISKFGPVTSKDFGSLMSGLVGDIMKDYLKDFQEDYNQLTKVEEKQVSKKLTTNVATLIRSNFLNIIDGTF